MALQDILNPFVPEAVIQEEDLVDLVEQDLK